MVVGRLKDKLLHPWGRPTDEAQAETETEASSNLPAVSPPRPLGFPSRVAEFLLVFRLRARRRSAGDLMERAVRMVLVTCKNWFSGSDPHRPRPRKHD